MARRSDANRYFLRAIAVTLSFGALLVPHGDLNVIDAQREVAHAGLVHDELHAEVGAVDVGRRPRRAPERRLAAVGGDGVTGRPVGAVVDLRADARAGLEQLHLRVAHDAGAGLAPFDLHLDPLDG